MADDNSLDGGTIAFIVIICVVFLMIIVFLFWARNKGNKNERDSIESYINFRNNQDQNRYKEDIAYQEIQNQVRYNNDVANRNQQDTDNRNQFEKNEFTERPFISKINPAAFPINAQEHRQFMEQQQD